MPEYIVNLAAERRGIEWEWNGANLDLTTECIFGNGGDVHFDAWDSGFDIKAFNPETRGSVVFRYFDTAICARYKHHRYQAHRYYPDRMIGRPWACGTIHLKVWRDTETMHKATQGRAVRISKFGTVI